MATYRRLLHLKKTGCANSLSPIWVLLTCIVKPLRIDVCLTGPEVAGTETVITNNSCYFPSPPHMGQSLVFVGLQQTLKSPPHEHKHSFVMDLFL